MIMKQNSLLCALFAGMLLFSCRSKQVKTNDMAENNAKLRVEIIDPEALAILDSTAKIEQLADSFKWTEGPLYISDGDYLIFSDIPDNKIYKWKEIDTQCT